MKIQMEVINSDNLDNYIDKKIVPFVVCAPKDVPFSKKQQRFLEKYYDKIVDKRGWVSFYCNIINAWKCKDMNYNSITFSNGKEEIIQDYNLEPHKSVGNKYIVVLYFKSGETIDSITLVKKIRLDVEKVKKKINK